MTRRIALLIDCDERDFERLRAYFEEKKQFYIEDPSDEIKGLECGGAALLVQPDASQGAPETVVPSATLSQPLLCAAIKAGADHFFPVPLAPELIAHICGEVTRQRTAEDAARRLLCELGLAVNFKGYRYVLAALVWIDERPELLGAMTKELYPGIARTFNTSASCVERAIRHEVEHLWENGDAEKLYEIFGATVEAKRGKPTNSAFLAALAERVKLARQRPQLMWRDSL